MTPRSSGPGGEYPPLRGTTNLRLTANQHCNVTENCAGVLAAATSPANRVAAQLQTAWVTLGKQTLSTSRKRRKAGKGGRKSSVAELAPHGCGRFFRIANPPRCDRADQEL